MRITLLSALILTAACGRPLTEAELKFATEFHGSGLDTSEIRITRSPFIQFYRYTVPIPPRLTCADKLFPPTDQKTFTGSANATVLFNTININPDVYSRDYLKAYPERANILAAMFLAHEFVHVWQWQHRDITGYHPLKAAREHRLSPDPYLFDLANDAEFLDFGYEQQGAIAGEYVCCAALAPDAPRTKRLEALLGAVFPIQNLTKSLPKTEFPLPWEDTEVDKLCT